MNGRQGGDPAKLAQALLAIADQEQPPRRFVAGVDAIGLAEQHVAHFQADINAFRDLSSSLALDEAATAAAAEHPSLSGSAPRHDREPLPSDDHRGRCVHGSRFR